MFAIRPGDRLVTYSGFSCIAADTVVTIAIDVGGMFFPCGDGKHYLESQRTKDDECLGLTRADLL
jgi:hypothetical protein